MLNGHVRQRIEAQQTQINAELAEAYETLERQQDMGRPTQATAALIDKLRMALRGTERLLNAKQLSAY